MPNKSLYAEILKFTFFMAILGCVFLRKSKIGLKCTLSCVNQVDDLDKNCTLKRDSDVSNFATNSHIELDDNSQVHPKTLTDLPNRFFSSVHVQPNLGIPLTRGFKIASINLASLYKNIDQLRIYMLSKTVDILAINETRLDSSIQNGEVNIPGYTLEWKDRNRK